MQHWIVILAGIVGTFLMTISAEIVAGLFKAPFHVVRILATMLPFKKRVEPPSTLTYVLASTVHYLIGVIFAYVYVWLLLHWINRDLFSATIYGATLGTIAVIVWSIFFRIHPNPPSIPLKGYLPVIWVGHVILALAMNGVMRFFSHPSLQETAISVCR